MNSNASAATVDLDTVLEILANRHRRRLLLALFERERQDDDAHWPDDLIESDEHSDAFRVTMRHCHLPKLAHAGLIEWDETRNVVRRGPRFEEVEPLLQLLIDRADEHHPGRR